MRLRRSGGAREGLSAAAGLLLLSALWAANSVRADLFPQLGGDAVTSAQRQAVLFAVFAALAACAAVARGVEFPRGWRAWAFAGIGVGFFVVPAALGALARDWISTLDRVAVFSLTPVFAVVLEPYLQGSEPRRGKAALAGAMGAVAGVLCLFPLQVPGSLRAGAALGALVAAALGIAATNCFAVRLAGEEAEGGMLTMGALAGAASAVCFGGAALTAGAEWHWGALAAQLPWVLVVELPALFLLFWLLRRMAASRMTARFVLAPLLTILAGLALEPMLPPARAWVGMALLAGGAGWMVFAPAEESGGENAGRVF